METVVPIESLSGDIRPNTILSNIVSSPAIYLCTTIDLQACRSTETASLKLTDDIRMCRGKQMLSAFLLFDFSKALYMVCHFTHLRKPNKSSSGSHLI